MKEYKWLIDRVLMVVVIVAITLGVSHALNVMDSDEQNLFVTNGLNNDRDAGYLSKYTQAYQIDEAHANTNFFRYASGAGNVWVVRITTSGTVTTWEKGLGTWANRTSLTYEPINDN